MVPIGFWPIFEHFVLNKVICAKSRFSGTGPNSCEFYEIPWRSVALNSIVITFFCIFYGFYALLEQILSASRVCFRIIAFFDLMVENIVFYVFLGKIDKIHLYLCNTCLYWFLGLKNMNLILFQWLEVNITLKDTLKVTLYFIISNIANDNFVNITHYLPRVIPVGKSTSTEF